MTHIVTIWWGNGQSSILQYFYDCFKENKLGGIRISSIFSMSDDGRTTGTLMKEFQKTFWIDLPPPWDLRRWLYYTSDTFERETIMKIYEHILTLEWNIAEYTMQQIVDTLDSLYKLPAEISWLRLEISAPISWHKCGNLLMACLYKHYDFDYWKMVDYMSTYLQVFSNIIPITTHRALMKATLVNGDEIHTQDRISNGADYWSAIKSIELMECSKYAQLNQDAIIHLKQADVVIITPWDLYTSILSNFFWKDISNAILESRASVYFMLNGNNKPWETTHYKAKDFIDIFVEKTWIIPDVVIGNESVPELSEIQKYEFTNDVSVKWWEFLLLNHTVKENIRWDYKNIRFLSGSYIEPGLLYKYTRQVVDDILEDIKK